MIRKTGENMCIPHHEETLVQWHRGKVKYRGENSLRRENKRKLAAYEHRTVFSIITGHTFIQITIESNLNKHASTNITTLDLATL